MIKRILLVLPVLTLFLLVGATIAEARCPPAGISLDISSGTAGVAVRIKGVDFATECNEGGRPGLPPGLSSPAKGVKLFFVQGQEKTLLAVVDADEKLQFSKTVTIPLTAVPGEARLVSEGRFVADGPTQGWNASFTVTVPGTAEPPVR